MFLKMNVLGRGNTFQYIPQSPVARTYSSVTVYGGNTIIDKLQIENYEMSDDDLALLNILDVNKWNPTTTILSSEFNNTLDGGNVINLNSKVTNWQLYRREVGSETLELIATLEA
jgi:hypothetical protein